MIINGQAVKGAKRLAHHLMKPENEKVSILEISGTASNDNLKGALMDMEALGRLTQSRTGKVLYHANINPQAHEVLSREDYIRSADRLMNELGFEGQPRAVVMHVKQGRQHAHLVVQLTDLDSGKLRPISNNYYKHRTVAKDLEKELRLDRSPRRKSGKSFEQKEAQQAKKLKVDVSHLRTVVTLAYETAKQGKDFLRNLKQSAIELAKGKRLVLVDERGGIHSLTRTLKATAKAKDIKDKLKDVIPDLPSPEEAKERQKLAENISEHNLLYQSEDIALRQLAEFRQKKLMEDVQARMIERQRQFQRQRGLEL